VRDADSPRLGGESAEHAKLLAELDVELPPIVLHQATMRVVDGMHRLTAAKIRGQTTIEATFFEGSEDDAFIEAVRLNMAHGLPLTLADRKAAAVRILRTHAEWSDRMIAGEIGLSPKTVGAIRRSTEELPHLTARVGRDGRVRGPRTPRARDRADHDATPDAVQSKAANPGRSLLTHELGSPTRSGRQGYGSDEFKRTYQLLCQDPSLRMSETGRFLLRLLSLHLFGVHEREQLLETVPPHRLESVAHLAGECARTWLDFAERVAKQSTKHEAL
jgi:hypothetical protein